MGRGLEKGGVALEVPSPAQVSLEGKGVWPKGEEFKKGGGAYKKWVGLQRSHHLPR